MTFHRKSTRSEVRLQIPSGLYLQLNMKKLCFAAFFIFKSELAQWPGFAGNFSFRKTIFTCTRLFGVLLDSRCERLEAVSGQIQRPSESLPVGSRPVCGSLELPTTEIFQLDPAAKRNGRERFFPQLAASADVCVPQICIDFKMSVENQERPNG